MSFDFCFKVDGGRHIAFHSPVPPTAYRMARPFAPIRDVESELYYAADRAAKGDLDAFLMEEGFCESADFSMFDPKSAYDVGSAIIKAVYRLPFLYRFISYAGSVTPLLRAEKEGRLASKLGLDPFSSKDDKKSFKVLLDDLASSFSLCPESWATSYRLPGYAAFLLFDEADFGVGYRDHLLRDIADCEESDWHPDGSGESPESIALHEIAHLADSLIGLSSSASFRSYRERIREEYVGEKLSAYALTNEREFVAEALSEALQPGPTRGVALDIYSLARRLARKKGLPLKAAART